MLVCADCVCECVPHCHCWQVIKVGEYLAFACWTSAGFLLVIRSKEGGLLLQGKHGACVCVRGIMCSLRA